MAGCGSASGWLWKRAGHWLFEHRYWAELETSTGPNSTQQRLVFYCAPPEVEIGDEQKRFHQDRGLDLSLCFKASLYKKAAAEKEPREEATAPDDEKKEDEEDGCSFAIRAPHLATGFVHLRCATASDKARWVQALAPLLADEPEPEPEPEQQPFGFNFKPDAAAAAKPHAGEAGGGGAAGGGAAGGSALNWNFRQFNAAAPAAPAPAAPFCAACMRSHIGDCPLAPPAGAPKFRFGPPAPATGAMVFGRPAEPAIDMAAVDRLMAAQRAEPPTGHLFAALGAAEDVLPAWAPAWVPGLRSARGDADDADDDDVLVDGKRAPVTDVERAARLAKMMEAQRNMDAQAPAFAAAEAQPAARAFTFAPSAAAARAMPVKASFSFARAGGGGSSPAGGGGGTFAFGRGSSPLFSFGTPERKFGADMAAGGSPRLPFTLSPPPPAGGIGTFSFGSPRPAGEREQRRERAAAAVSGGGGECKQSPPHYVI